MKMFYGTGASGKVSEALRGVSSPKLIIMTSPAELFEENVAALEKAYPGVPSIGCIAMGYQNKVEEKGVTITAFTEGVTCAAGVLEEVSKAPAKFISRLKDDISRIKPGNNNTAIIDFCSGNDAGVLNTLSLLIKNHNLQLMGATGDAGKVSANGKIYEDGMAYALIKNEGGKVKAYKENIYTPREGVRLIASKTNKSKYYIGELNGRPAKQVYMNLTGCDEKGIENQTFTNPLGKMIGDDICIVSLKGIEGNGLTCYRQVNDSDILTLLEMNDPMDIAQNTVDSIKNDFNRVSGIYSVNCAFRYILLQDRGQLGDYLSKIASVGTSCGLVGYGEHYNGQFVNQTMTCVVFE
ncbi:MAG: hypothetical protein J6N76_00170 [Lachnospiraceae bacterium]|nr:hypothetical protein [Lachnospiraceae bacterium]